MDCAACLLSPRSPPSSFSPLPSPRSSSSSSCSCSPSSSSTCSFSFSFSPRPAASIDLDSSSSSLWGSRPFTTPLQDPPPSRHRPPALNISNYATTTAEPASPAAHPWGSAASRTTHYTLLGVSPTSSPREIRTAYRKLALQHHPDVSPLHQLDKSTKLFAQINEAYTTLSDPQKKACYDLKLALESPTAADPAMSPVYHHSSPSPRAYTDASTGRVYPSMNSFYREWRRNHN